MKKTIGTTLPRRDPVARRRRQRDALAAMIEKSFEPYTFEADAHVNGGVTWSEDDLMRKLEYTDRAAFKKVRMRAMQACLSLQIDIDREFIRVRDDLTGREGYRFTRFACYLIAMNADSKKTAVATAQAYFAKLADEVQKALDQVDVIDRLIVRDEVRDGMKSLAATAHRHGVESFARFQNAGYRGMYNLDAREGIQELGDRKGLEPGEHLIDRMGRAELAANLFRVTQTEQKIAKDNIRGQTALEDAAEAVGRVVREAIIASGGTAPESLPLAEHIQDAKRKVKAARKVMKELSTPAANRELQYVHVQERHLILSDPSEQSSFTRDPEEDDDGSSD
jgi:DNA-damage-inducible protein D